MNWHLRIQQPYTLLTLSHQILTNALQRVSIRANAATKIFESNYFLFKCCVLLLLTSFEADNCQRQKILKYFLLLFVLALLSYFFLPLYLSSSPSLSPPSPPLSLVLGVSRARTSRSSGPCFDPAILTRSHRSPIDTLT